MEVLTVAQSQLQNALHFLSLLSVDDPSAQRPGLPLPDEEHATASSYPDHPIPQSAAFVPNQCRIY